MARPKKTPDPAPAPAPSPFGGERQPLIFQLRGTPEFKAWLQAAADHARLDVTSFVEQSVAAHARTLGFAPVAPRRKGK